MLPSEKPRERLIKYGVSNLSNEDLISVILRSGTKDMNVKNLSVKLLSEIKGINNLKNISLPELQKIKGIGLAKAASLLCALELGIRVINEEVNQGIVVNSPDKIHKYFSHLIGYKDKEEVLIILLDNKKRLISYKIMYKGTSTSCSASVKEIIHYGIVNNADALIMMHNHPSKMLTPSKEDITLTNDLIKAGKMIGIPLLDHLITNGKEYYSFFDANN